MHDEIDFVGLAKEFYEQAQITLDIGEECMGHYYDDLAPEQNEYLNGYVLRLQFGGINCNERDII